MSKKQPAKTEGKAEERVQDEAAPVAAPASSPYSDYPDAPVKVFSGEPLDLQVGDIFETASNPGGGVYVTPKVLEELVARNKALPPSSDR